MLFYQLDHYTAGTFRVQLCAGRHKVFLTSPDVFSFLDKNLLHSQLSDVFGCSVTKSFLHKGEPFRKGTCM